MGEGGIHGKKCNVVGCVFVVLGKVRPVGFIGGLIVQVLRNFIFPLVFTVFLCGGVAAQPDIEAKVQRLEQTVRVLERRTEALEAQLIRLRAPSLGATDRTAWRKLQRGKSQSEVEKLLGSPTRVDAISDITFWYYGDRGGRVRFDGAVPTVSAWNEP